MAIGMGPLPSTSGRDRTSEFHAIVDRLRKTQGSTLPYANGSTNGAVATNGHSTSETARLLPQPTGNSLQSEFTKRASQIGLSIHQTSQKLSKLAKCEYSASLPARFFVKNDRRESSVENCHFFVLSEPLRAESSVKETVTKIKVFLRILWSAGFVT